MRHALSQVGSRLAVASSAKMSRPPATAGFTTGIAATWRRKASTSALVPAAGGCPLRSTSLAIVSIWERASGQFQQGIRNPPALPSRRRKGAAAMLIATTERVAGHEVAETLGEVFGIAVRSRGVVGNLLAGLQTIVGGEIHQYTEMLQTARQHAIDR